MKRAFTIDGKVFPHIAVTSLRRSFSILDGDNAGRVMSGDMQRDLIGTYYNYSMEIDATFSSPAEYDEFYEIISAPVDSHSVSFPYGQRYLDFKAYITNGEDNLAEMYDEVNLWQDLTINFIAMSPARRPL